MTTASYATDHADALSDVTAAGQPVTFTLAGSVTVDPSTGAETIGSGSTVSGYAIEKPGSLYAYQALGLVLAQAVTLIAVLSDYTASVPLNSVVIWNGVSYTVRNVKRVAPDGKTLLSTVIVSV